MFRRRTALSVTAATALLAATPLLAACGKDAHPGAAAVVDGQRITVAQLQGRVKGVRDAQNASPQAAQLIQNTGQLGRSTLNGMIFARVLERGARDAGVKVTRRDVQEWRKGAEARAGGPDRLRQMWLQQAIAPGDIDTVVRNQLLLDGLAKQLGADRGRPQGQQQLVQALSKTSRGMAIDVNPRYGKWNDKDVILGETKEPWVTPAPGAERQQT